MWLIYDTVLFNWKYAILNIRPENSSSSYVVNDIYVFLLYALQISKENKRNFNFIFWKTQCWSTSNLTCLNKIQIPRWFNNSFLFLLLLQLLELLILESLYLQSDNIFITILSGEVRGCGSHRTEIWGWRTGHDPEDTL